MLAVGQDGTLATGAKQRDEEALRRSIVETATTPTIPPVDQGFVLFVAQQADGFVQWGRAPKLRDKQLRQFIPTENWFASALASVVSRNVTFSWKLEGDDALVKASQQMLLNADRGQGWDSLWSKVSYDLYTQDNGAFVEFIRAGEGPAAPVVNIAHLDADRCYQTGDPEKPVIYQDRLGKLHLLDWWNVYQFLELPSAYESVHAGVFYRLQYSAATRLLRAAQVLRNVSTYQDEKTAGRFVRAIHILRGVGAQQIQDAIARQTLQADQAGLREYLQPLFVSSVDPKAEVDVKTVEMASLPDGFKFEEMMKWYIAALALAFLVDYQEFAPLPGGGLGTSNQSQVLHMKSRGKGPGLYQKLVAHMLNFSGALPANVTFSWDEQDIDADKAQAELQKLHAEEREIRVHTGELDEQAARSVAVAQGDLDQELYDEIEAREKERAAMDEQQAATDAQLRQQELQLRFGRGDTSAPDDRRSGANLDAGGSDPETTVDDNAPRRKEVSPERLALEDHVTDQLGDALEIAFSGVRKRLRAPASRDKDKGRRRTTTKFVKDADGRTIGAVQEETWA